MPFVFDRFDNCNVTPPAPYRLILTALNDKQKLVEVTQKVEHKEWYFTFRFHYYIGVPSTAETEDFVYSLPYKASEHYRIGQSYFGTASHKKGTAQEYAVDILMPEKTQILAARDGVVVAIRDDSNMGGNDAKFDQCANYVVIKHSDGTYAMYLHISQKGALVSLGQNVATGTPIALSGKTGHVSAPHLHFMIYRVSDQADMVKGIHSLPFRTRVPAPQESAGDTNSAATQNVVPELLKGQNY